MKEHELLNYASLTTSSRMSMASVKIQQPSVLDSKCQGYLPEITIYSFRGVDLVVKGFATRITATVQLYGQIYVVGEIISEKEDLCKTRSLYQRFITIMTKPDFLIQWPYVIVDIVRDKLS